MYYYLIVPLLADTILICPAITKWSFALLPVGRVDSVARLIIIIIPFTTNIY